MVLLWTSMKIQMQEQVDIERGSTDKLTAITCDQSMCICSISLLYILLFCCEQRCIVCCYNVSLWWWRVQLMWTWLCLTCLTLWHSLNRLLPIPITRMQLLVPPVDSLGSFSRTFGVRATVLLDVGALVCIIVDSYLHLCVILLSLYCLFLLFSIFAYFSDIVIFSIRF